jgi:hypothetical protein
MTDHEESGDQGPREASDNATRSKTKYGDRIEGHDWSAPERESEPTPEARVTHQWLVILDERPDEQDIEYTFAIADDTTEDLVLGTIFAVDRGHRLGDSNQFDPMGYVAWEDVPERVKAAASEALGMGLEERVDVEQVNDMVRGWGDGDD